jgi:ABC-type molybdate transport system permease subunit
LIPFQSIYATAPCDFPVRHDPSDLQCFKGVEVNQIKLARTFGASKARILTKVILPGSIPTMIAALKVNAGLWRHRPGREVRHAPATARCR